ncbi:MAG: trypsin-like peptidase domain-containing protein [Oscillospiraceae bacterium]|nr:trypsin-like peptidase domain-containing protein [Oscillospiraceae bacterium]
MSRTRKFAGIWKKLIIFAAMVLVLLSGCAAELDKEQLEDFIINFADPNEIKAELSDEEIIENISKSTAKIKNLEEALEDGEFSGIGIIISENGYIIANAKILGKDNEVIAPDGNVYSAELKKTFAEDRLALIKIEAEGLLPVKIADTANMEKGETVVMLKNFVQSFSSVTVIRGTVSADVGEENIQTDIEESADDANSLLLNSYGQVIGMSGYVNPETGTEFSNANEVVDDLIVKGYKVLEKLGIVGRPVSEIEAKTHSVPQGILITEISEKSDLSANGGQVGDIIEKINGVEIRSFIDAYFVLEKYAPGDVVKLSLHRQDPNRASGYRFEVDVTVQDVTV